jgi:hypothetical protein
MTYLSAKRKGPTQALMIKNKIKYKQTNLVINDYRYLRIYIIYIPKVKVNLFQCDLVVDSRKENPSTLFTMESYFVEEDWLIIIYMFNFPQKYYSLEVK